MDLDDHPNGEFHASLELSIAPVSDVNMGFVQGKANQTRADRNVALSNIVFASDVADEDDYVVSSNISGLNGVSLFRQTVYSGSTIVGHYNIILAHNANNEVGYHVYWDGEAGATGATLTALNFGLPSRQAMPRVAVVAVERPRHSARDKPIRPLLAAGTGPTPSILASRCRRQAGSR